MQTQVKRTRNAMYAIVGVLLLGLGTARAAEPGEACQQKLKSIIVPTIDFENATLEQAVAFTRRRSKELDPKGEGINIVLKLAATSSVAPAVIPDAQADNKPAPEPVAPSKGAITLSLTNVSLWDLIRYTAIAADIKYRVDDNAVILFDKPVPLDPSPDARPALNQVRILVTLVDGKQELTSASVIGMSGDTVSCSREQAPVPSSVPAAEEKRNVDQARSTAGQNDDAENNADEQKPFVEHSLQVTPTVDKDNYTMAVKLAWEAVVPPVGQAIPRRLRVNTSVFIWDGATLSFPVAAAGEIAGHGELTLVIRATMLNPAGQPLRSEK